MEKHPVLESIKAGEIVLVWPEDETQVITGEQLETIYNSYVEKTDRLNQTPDRSKEEYDARNSLCKEFLVDTLTFLERDLSARGLKTILDDCTDRYFYTERRPLGRRRSFEGALPMARLVLVREGVLEQAGIGGMEYKLANRDKTIS